MFRWLLLISLVLIDQVLKLLVLTFAEKGGFITIAFNTGTTFGIFPGSNSIMIVVSIIAIAVIGYFSRSSKEWEALGLIIILGGVIGNFLDRILQGAVTDYIAIGTFPIFNFADMCIVTGIVIVLLKEFKFLKSVKFIKVI